MHASSTYDSKEDYSMPSGRVIYIILSFSLFVFISLSSKTSVKRAHREIQYNCVIYQSYLLIIMSLPEKSVGSTSNGGLPRGDKTTHLVQTPVFNETTTQCRCNKYVEGCSPILFQRRTKDGISHGTRRDA